MPFFQTQHYYFQCDDCGAAQYFMNPKQARKNGWAVAKNYKNCYCPNCAPAHRNTGRNGVQRRKP